MEKIIVNALPDLLKEEFTLKPTLVGVTNSFVVLVDGKSLNDNPPEQSFFVDISENKDLFEQALNNLDFTVDMCAALVVNDLLSLYDTFGNNHQNFGIYKKDNKFTFKFVDFLANGNNGFYSLVLKKIKVLFIKKFGNAFGVAFEKAKKETERLLNLKQNLK